MSRLRKSSHVELTPRNSKPTLICSGYLCTKAIRCRRFKEAQKFYKGTSGYYGKVKGWFLNKYPNYQDVDFADIATSQKPEEKASAPAELRKTA